MTLVVTLAIRVVVFGIALAFASRAIPGVTVQPRSALPIVALIFAILNALLYTLLSKAVTWLSLFLLWFAAPFIANAIVLWLTDRLSKPLRIDGLFALGGASLVVTIAHVLLRVFGL